MAELGATYRRSSPTQLLLAVYALVGGLISFLGWYADVPRLTDWGNAGISIQPNATIAVMCAALAVLLLRAGYRRMAGAFGLLVAAIGSTVLFESLTGISLGIDDLLMFGRTWGRQAVIVPGRMGPPGAISWTVLGLGLFFAAFASDRRWPRSLSPALALIGLTIGSLALIGYLYGVSLFYTVPTVTAIAFQTSTFIVAVAIGLLFALPERAPIRLLDETSPAGGLARKMLPAVILVPIGLGLIRLTGEQMGFYGLAVGTALRTIAEIALLSALLWWAAYTIGRQTEARRDAEKQLVQSLRDADRRKNEFIAVLAHELRNPLAPIRNAVGLLRLKTANDATLAKASEVIERQVVLMARLLDDLLDVGRITNNKLELRRERVDLGTVVRDAVEMCRPLIQQHEHEVSVGMPSDPIYLDADPARLGQVFSNLMNNACKYTDRRGRISINVERRHDLDVIVTVADNGIGIPESERASIFEMFSQIDRASHKPYGGLGIGLHLVKRLVEMHGGTIDVHSAGPGQGSTFTVRLPLTSRMPAQAPAELAAPAAADSTSPSRRILIVDDNVDHADSLATLLGMEGHEIYVEHNGITGLEAAERLRPEVVILDLGLPFVDGLDACRRIRKQRWGKRMLLIAVTGWGQEIDRRHSSEAGFDHHLVKPVDARTLQSLLAGEEPVKASAGTPAEPLTG
jgi:signal transduction histidine kinase/CheY-like chemotaxis protein